MVTRHWLVPGITIALMLGAGLTILADLGPVLRPICVLAFLLFAPGLPWAALFPVRHISQLLLLALTLSLGVAMVLSMAMVYLQLWSIPSATVVLMLISLAGLAAWLSRRTMRRRSVGEGHGTSNTIVTNHGGATR
jgi:uncharacterized membrane protein